MQIRQTSLKWQSSLKYHTSREALHDSKDGGKKQQTLYMFIFRELHSEQNHIVKVVNKAFENVTEF
jgi:hypothetical protein